jgi:hypothetical protein
MVLEHVFLAQDCLPGVNSRCQAIKSNEASAQAKSKVRTGPRGKMPGLTVNRITKPHGPYMDQLDGSIR